MNKEAIETIIINTLTDIMDEYAIEYEVINSESKIYGTKDGISSLMLVRLIVDLEEAIDIETNQSITIADEKVLSMNNSPFATVATLTDYLSQLIQQSVVV
jgi:acyl carrier protein